MNSDQTTQDNGRASVAVHGPLHPLVIPPGGFRCIVADPPWEQRFTGAWKRRKKPRERLPYSTMTVAQIAAIPVAELAAEDAHLWLWTTNQFLESGFAVMRSWGFRYLAPITWVKDSGFGCYWRHRTQTLLMGYRHRCRFAGERFLDTVLLGGTPKRHSQKPESAFELIERVSQVPRLEMFARERRLGWASWGNEV